jgi:hypothetical protein
MMKLFIIYLMEYLLAGFLQLIFLYKFVKKFYLVKFNFKFKIK